MLSFSKVKSHIREKLILIGIVRPLQADGFSENDEPLPEEQRKAQKKLREFTEQRRAQFHR